mgnify:FL=1
MLLKLRCNDPANGIHTGRCDGIEIFTSEKHPDALLELHGTAWRCHREEVSWLIFGRQRLLIRRYKAWVGNWCWDAAIVPAVFDIANLLVALQRSTYWDVESGDSKLFDTWHARAAKRQTWERLLSEAMKADQCPSTSRSHRPRPEDLRVQCFPEERP